MGSKPTVVIFDCSEFNDDGVEQLRVALNPLGVQVYDLEMEVYGEAVSDTYIIAFSQDKLSSKELQKLGKEYGLGESL